MRCLSLNPYITVHLQEAKWGFRKLNVIRKVIKACHLKKSYLCIKLSDDKMMKRLNFKWRGVNKSTNVLSFPSYHKDKATKDNMQNLGDIILSYDTIRKQSITYHKPFSAHLAHLLVHGILHLKGYTHNLKYQARFMESEEIRILNSLNINNPYLIY